MAVKRSVSNDGTLVCKSCGVEKNVSEFFKRSDTGRHVHFRSHCKACTTAKNKVWFDKNVQRTRELHKFKNIRAKYGISREQYEGLLEKQNNCCPICHITFSKEWGPKFPCVDHCHASGMVRGILCRNCNSVLGMVHESEERLNIFIKYIRLELNNACI